MKRPTKEEISRIMSAISRMRKVYKGGHGPGPRCPCGLYTIGRAKSRKHKCKPGDKPIKRKRGRPKKKKTTE